MALQPPVIIGGDELPDGRQHLVKGEGNKVKDVQVSDVLTHPMAGSERGASRDRWKYRFLRVTKWPTIDRPDSGRIIVENVATGRRTEHYAMLFNTRFQ
jgi:hypothetical protein